MVLHTTHNYLAVFHRILCQTRKMFWRWEALKLWQIMMRSINLLFSFNINNFDILTFLIGYLPKQYSLICTQLSSKTLLIHIIFERSFLAWCIIRTTAGHSGNYLPIICVWIYQDQRLSCSNRDYPCKGYNEFVESSLMYGLVLQLNWKLLWRAAVLILRHLFISGQKIFSWQAY